MTNKDILQGVGIILGCFIAAVIMSIITSTNPLMSMQPVSSYEKVCIDGLEWIKSDKGIAVNVDVNGKPKMCE